MTSENPGRAFVLRVRAEISAANFAGADEHDYCIVMPISYLAVVYCWPVIELAGRRVAACTTGEALAVLQMFALESGWSPPPSSQHSGLWGFSR